MEVIIARSFLRDLKSKPRPVINSVEKLISKLEMADSLEKSGIDFKKMEGQRSGENYYRIRLGIWRIGVEYVHPNIIMLRILARGQVYKHFPPH